VRAALALERSRSAAAPQGTGLQVPERARVALVCASDLNAPALQSPEA